MSVCLYVTFYNPSKVTASPSTFIFGRAQTSPIRSNVCLYVCVYVTHSGDKIDSIFLCVTPCVSPLHSILSYHVPLSIQGIFLGHARRAVASI